MAFFADFHIHSKYSRATSKSLDLENLYIAAQLKGLTVIGTGDITHPAWFEELKTKLQPAEEGLFRLRREIADQCDTLVPPACRQPVRFLLVTEISSIYKKAGKTRKNHNLVFMPDLEAVDRLNRRLGKIGNIVSDGRPILGLDSRDLLEIVLETATNGYLVPAHIWTPWFSLLGSKSGFDQVDECFEDLSDHIFAVETGLSSDPKMNWRVSDLDRFTLISNSDAHSPGKLGREANIFQTPLTFTDIKHALQAAPSDQFLGTVEFYPEEGKYHLDGHRKCNFRCNPHQTRALDGLCPVCGKPLTLGVLYRVEALADRNERIRPPKAKPYHSLIPLENLLSEVLQVGPASKKVALAYQNLVNRLGSEFRILLNLSKDEIFTAGIPLLAEAIQRMRDRQVSYEPGYDGEFGKVRIFSTEERQQLLGQMGLFKISVQIPRTDPKVAGEIAKKPPNEDSRNIETQTAPEPAFKPMVLNPEQQAVVDQVTGSMLIVAGPGTGKTRTITSRIAALIKTQEISSDNILAMTFTQKAAQEMQARLKIEIGTPKPLPLVTTFHGFCWQLIRECHPERPVAIVSETARKIFLKDVVRQVAPPEAQILSMGGLMDYIIRAKQLGLAPGQDLTALVPDEHRAYVAGVYAVYQDLLGFQDLFDFEDLIFYVVKRLQSDYKWRVNIQNRFSHIFIDEFQDINESQYLLIKALIHPATHLCAIGDPNQAIYGFRGSDRRFFYQIIEDYPQTRRIRLNRNYRSTDIILAASFQVIQGQDTQQEASGPLLSNIQGVDAVSIIETASARAEAVAIGKKIEQMIGGMGFHSIDFGHTGTNSYAERSFSDFAVLYRTNAQGGVLAEVLTRAGIPCQLTDHSAFLEQPVVAKIMAVLRLLAHQANYADLIFFSDLIHPALSKNALQAFKDWAYTQRIPLWPGMQSSMKFPVPGMSKTSQHRLVELVRFFQDLMDKSEDRTVTEQIELIVKQSPLPFQGQEEVLHQMMTQAQTYGSSLDQYLVGQAIQSDTDMVSFHTEKVTLLTMHAAKGLEFPIVFIAGCEDGLVPHRPRFSADGELDEERRLFYVAMTRAREQLILSWARKRTLYGLTRIQEPSPFLLDIEHSLKEAQAIQTAKQRQLSLF